MTPTRKPKIDFSTLVLGACTAFILDFGMLGCTISPDMFSSNEVTTFSRERKKETFQDVQLTLNFVIINFQESGLYCLL